MPSQVFSGQVFRFGLFEADVARHNLTSGGVRVKIQDQPFRVLLVLLEHAGEIVTRDELRQRLWPEGTYVAFDGSLNATLKKLRAAIDDDPDNPRFIETVPRRGYRFIAPVSLNHEKDNSVASQPGATPVSLPFSLENMEPAVNNHLVRLRRLRYALPLLALVGIALTGWFAWPSKWWAAPGGTACFCGIGLTARRR